MINDQMRIGIGYDVHRLVEGRELILGGVKIPFDRGLLGHSDADVLTHAIMDAILGALALGDIGKFFPDSDERYKDVDSMELMKIVREWMNAEGYRIGNIDAIIIAQAPKCAPYIDAMRKRIAEVLKTEIGRVCVKATTEEGLGFTGKGEGIAAKAAVCLYEK